MYCSILHLNLFSRLILLSFDLVLTLKCVKHIINLMIAICYTLMLVFRLTKLAAVAFEILIVK